jgi:hypothetical protein
MNTNHVVNDNTEIKTEHLISEPFKWGKDERRQHLKRTFKC